MPRKKSGIPYLLAKAAGALQKYHGLSPEDAFKHATRVLQGAGLLKPRSHSLTKFGLKLEKSLKISKGLRKRKIKL